MAANASTKKVLKRPLYEEIKRDLLDQLDRNGVIGKQYIDLVDDYMDLWVTKCLLVDDIQSRGVNVVYQNGPDQYGTKKNDSIEQRIKVNGQMLKLLSEIGIKPVQTGGDGDEL
jgi:hypothetical protein